MTRVRLGELLLSRGVCTREHLSAAWEQKVLYGDRLGTNLLAIGAISEADLAIALGVQQGVHAGHGGVLQVDSAAVAMVPKTIAQKRKVVPHHVADRTLFLAMRDPDDLRAIDEVRFATRLKVQPIVVCEARLWQLLADHYGVSLTMRPNPLDRRGPRMSSSSGPSASPSVSGDDLVSEEEFHALYARLAATPLHVDGLHDEADPAAPSSSPPPAMADAPSWQQATKPQRLPLVAGMMSDPHSAESAPLPPPATTSPPPPPPPTTTMSSSPPPPAPAPMAMAAPVPSDTLADDWQRSLEATNPLRALPNASGLEEIELVEVVDFDQDTMPPDGPNPFDFGTPNTSQIVAMPDLSPLSFDAAVELLRHASDREDISRIVLRAARHRFARACLLTVYPQAYVGFMGVGDGFEDVAGVAVEKSAPSVFQLVEKSRAHYLGPLQRFVAHGAWVKATGKRIPRTIVVLPILVREKVVSLLVCDNGHDAHVDGDVGELLILSQHIAGSYEALIRQG